MITCAVRKDTCAVTCKFGLLIVPSIPRCIMLDESRVTAPNIRTRHDTLRMRHGGSGGRWRMMGTRANPEGVGGAVSSWLRRMVWCRSLTVKSDSSRCIQVSLAQACDTLFSGFREPRWWSVDEITLISCVKILVRKATIKKQTPLRRWWRRNLHGNVFGFHRLPPDLRLRRPS